MNKILNNQLIKAFALCFGFFSFAACNEDSVIKPDLVPPVDNIHTFAMTIDSFGVTLQPGYFDSIRLDAYDNPIAVIGSMIDPFFGKTTAGLYLQVTPPSANYTFPDDIAGFDSVVLALPYYPYSYGDTTNPAGNYQTIDVYRIVQNDFNLYGSNDTTQLPYYTFNSLNIDPLPLGSKLVSLSSLTTDSVTYPSGSTVGNTLRIKFSNTALATEFKGLDTAILKDNNSFTNYFKGFYIAPDTTDAAANQRRLSYFYLGDANTTASTDFARLEIFYHESDGTSKNIFFLFKPGGSAFFSGIKRKYTSYPVSSITNNLTTYHDSIVVQSFPGLYTYVTINNIQKIPKAIINKATLTLTSLNAAGSDTFYTSSGIIPNGVNDDGSLYTISDYLDNAGTSTSVNIGGTLQYVTLNGQKHAQYQINIPRELQQAILSGKDHIKLRLAFQLSYPGAYRFLAGGVNGDENTRLKFDVVYTKQNP